MYNILVLLVFVSVTNARDITVGSDAGKKIFDENFQASPAIWRQVQNVTINTTDDEVISKIIVKDLRAEKDGEVNIVDGGEGQEKVTLELKSPTALRGYDFHIEAYAVPKSQEKVKDEDKLQDDLTHPRQVGVAKNPPETSQSTELNFADPRINHDDRATIIPESNEKRLPLIISADTNDNNNERKIRDTTHDTNKQDGDSLKSKHPSLAGVEIKKTEIPVNKYGENKSEGSNNPKPGDAETNNGDMLPMDKDLKENNGETRHTRAFDDETNKKVTSKIDKTNGNRRIGNDEGTPKSTKEPNFSPLNKNSASLSFPPPTPTANDRNARETNKNTKSEVSMTPVSNNGNYPTRFSSQTDSKNVPLTFSQDTPSIDSLKTNAPDVKSITNNPDIKDKNEKLAPTIITGKNDKPEPTITNDKERIVRDTHNEDKIENYNLPRSLGSSNITNDQNNEKSGYSPTSLKESIIPAVSINGQNKTNPESDKPAVEHKDEKQIPAVTSRGSNKPDSTMTNDKERTARDTNNADKNENHNIPKALNSNDNNERSGNLPQMLKNINIPTLLLNEDNKSNPVSTSPPNNPLVENKGTSPQPVTSQYTNPSEANDYLHTSTHQEHPVPYPYDASLTTPKVDHKRDTSSDKVDTVKDSSRKSPRLASTTENIELSTVKVNIPRVSGQAVPYSYTTPKSEHKRDTVSTEKSAEKNEDARSEDNLKIPPKIFGNGNAKPVISIQ